MRNNLEVNPMQDYINLTTLAHDYNGPQGLMDYIYDCGDLNGMLETIDYYAPIIENYENHINTLQNENVNLQNLNMNMQKTIKHQRNVIVGLSVVGSAYIGLRIYKYFKNKKNRG